MKVQIKKLRLKWKVFGFLLGFCALLLIILWLFQTVFLDSFYRAIKQNEVKNDAQYIAENIDNKNLPELLASISENSDVYVEVMALNGEELYLYGTTKNYIPPAEKMKLIAQAQSAGGEYYGYINNMPQKPAGNEFPGNLPPQNMQQPLQPLVYVRLVQSSSKAQMAIIINAIISPVNATVTTLRYQLYLITGIMIILAVLLALIIAKRVSKPIEEINRSAKVLAQGDYAVHFSGQGFLEIEELSDTLNHAARELSKVDALRRELMANISHDLRTPLSLIYSYAEVMHDFPNEITPEQTQIIMDETRRLTTLVNDVLDISKLETGMQQLNITDFNLTRSIKAISERIAELVRNDGYQILFNYDREAMVCADEVKIIQACYNLLINAINYAGNDKTVSINQMTAEGKVRIEITDTGEGIDPGDLPYIWERYYKVDKKHKRAVTGTGLGLSIVKKVIELHGGECGVKSQVGQGSTFWFELRTIS